MSIRHRLSQTIRRMLADVRERRHKRFQEKKRERYINGGRIPWSSGYLQVRMEMVGESLASKEVMRSFQGGQPLPKGYGYALDERMVEYPWVISRLSHAPCVMLDAGSTFNHRIIVDAIDHLDKDLTISTLGAEADCFWHKRISYQFCDLRKTPFQDGWFDEIVCISTLEHIGMDNSIYRDDKGDFTYGGEGDYRAAAAELWRILKPGGRLFITVPYGVRQIIKHKGSPSMVQFNRDMVMALCEQFPDAKIEMAFYRYTSEGWNISDQTQCDDATYYDYLNTRTPAGDLAAAARAVACLQIDKLL